jgi:hypothetical protein
MDSWWDTHAYQQNNNLTAQRNGLRAASMMTASTLTTASPALTATDPVCD